MKTLIVASNNMNKINEIKNMLPDYTILSLKDFGDYDIIENGLTFEDNAIIKARFLNNLTDLPVLADDSGLCVEALNGGPGVYSARYAGVESQKDHHNMMKVLKKLENESNRHAYFICAMALVVSKSQEYVTIGRMDGEIIDERIGDNGFGYDPIFYYPPLQLTNAQMTKQQKNEVSHRAKALKAMIPIIKEVL